ncbi:MAG: acyl-CoA ligase (AMP-forming), exosortase A system-associated [Planctomycetes bacterium]|nr:acyl-CoA ligase (AMP-forming), exosortase A system-associated [Planctomycetota bacterium]
MHPDRSAVRFVHDLLIRAGSLWPDRTCLVHRDRRLDPAGLLRAARALAAVLRARGLAAGDRVAIHFEKNVEKAVAIFAVSLAGGVFVVVNPLLKHRQVRQILADSGAACLITSAARLVGLAGHLDGVADLRFVVRAGADSFPPDDRTGGPDIVDWPDAAAPPAPADGAARAPGDLAAILYTSGSSGPPKGVMLSHENLLDGAAIVSGYLGLRADDRLASVLPFSFDYGLNQLLSALLVGGTVVLVNYLSAQDVVRAVRDDRVTVLAGIPTIWAQLARAKWTAADFARLRCITNSGGVFHESLVREYRRRLPHTRIFLMYGFTEAFRSTYLDPAELDRRPGSMGKAVPGVEILVLDEHGRRCGPGEVGELVHRGALVSLGYWNDPERTRAKFRPNPAAAPGAAAEIVAFSGDAVKTDADGYLYFVGRRDEMIKVSGFRVSPSEIEDFVLSTGLVSEAVAVGVPDAELGESIVLFVVPDRPGAEAPEALRRALAAELPRYMIPRHVVEQDALPRNPNGKVDRSGLRRRARAEFAG